MSLKAAVSFRPVSEAKVSEPSSQLLRLNVRASQDAIAELKRRGKAEWGASYYSQLAPADLCRLAGRPRRVQYGALISWLKRLADGHKAVPQGGIALVAHLTESSIEDCTAQTDEMEADMMPLWRSSPERKSAREGRFEVNCPSAVHDHRFVVVGELPLDDLFPVVLVQPLDGTGYWYPQSSRHNPLRAGRAFCCFVQLGNPVGVWHVRRPPLDAKIRVLALEREWNDDSGLRLLEHELAQRAAALGVVAQKDSMTSRISTDPLAPTLRDGGPYAERPLDHDEPEAVSCVAPLTLDWKGGAAYIEVREGAGDVLLFQGTAGPGAVVTLAGRGDTSSALFELEQPGRYRVRLFPGTKGFLDPPYEWWLDIR